MDQTNQFALGLFLAVVLITLLNIAIFGLSLKLYTEYFKDRSINARPRDRF